jgi:hypothetical protein
MITIEIIAASGIKNKINLTKNKWAWAEIIMYAIMISAIVFFRGPGSEFIYFQF